MIAPLLLALAVIPAIVLAEPSTEVVYSYDNLNRLTRADYANGGSISYSYDDMGNRSQVVTVPNPDIDADLILNESDNCIYEPNPDQDDTDGDKCGNVCDADYDQDGIVGFSDFGQFGAAYNGFDLEFDHTEPITGPVGFGDFGKLGAFNGLAAGR